MKIVFLDSGVDIRHPIFSNKSIKTFIYDHQNHLLKKCGSPPLNGHGTAVVSAFLKAINNLTDVEIISVDIFHNMELQIEASQLTDTLRYIYNNLNCDIINISCGCLQDIPELKEVCKLLVQRGVIIISAFSNEGEVSFPAAYDGVIGVTTSKDVSKLGEYIYIDGSIVNICAAICNQRLAWLDKSYVILCGTSFVAPLISSKVCDYLSVPNNMSVFEYLKKGASHYLRYTYTSETKMRFPQIGAAAVFPYNKEVDAIVRYSHLLSFPITHIFDSKYSGKVGFNVASMTNSSLIIENIDDCNWTGFDTIILGHTSDLQVRTNIDYKTNIINECQKRNINIISFEEIDTKVSPPPNIYFPKIYRSYKNSNKFGKLYEIISPVLCIAGTSSQQGKFSLQLRLIELFHKDGYSVSHLSSEPEGVIFGAQATYHYGFKGTADLTGLDSIEYVNALMHELDLFCPDIILTGSQSSSSICSYGNLNLINLPTINFLLGVKPDAIVLCVNYHDTLELISKTIQFVESLTDGKVIALSMFPLAYINAWDELRNVKRIVPIQQINEMMQRIITETNKPCYLLGDPHQEEKLYKNCIDYFVD